MANEKGVWRTIGGRRVFIKEGQDLASAMKESGKFKSASKGTAKKPMTEEEKAKKINETMDRRHEVIDRLDKETYGLDNYDRYNLALSKLENTEGMRPMERQYWAGIKERYEKNQKANNDRANAGASSQEKVLEDFKNSDGSKEKFEKALNKISEMEYNNEINPDEYKDYISKIQKEYVEKNRKTNSDREASRNIDEELKAKYDELRKDRKGLVYNLEEGYLKDLSNEEKLAKLNKELDDINKQKENIKKIDKEAMEYQREKHGEKGAEEYKKYMNQGDDTFKKATDGKKLEAYRINEDGKKEMYERTLGDDERGYWTKENGQRVFKENPNYRGEKNEGLKTSNKELASNSGSESISKDIKVKNYEGTYIVTDKGANIGEFKTQAEAEKFAQSKAGNQKMNEAIRSRGKSKVEEDDLPKHTEIKTQGTSNRKEVSENIQAHILDYYTEDYTGENISPSEAFVRQMDAMGESNMWRAGQKIAEGGSYLIYNGDMADFLDELKINPKGKTFSEDKAFDMYTSLIGRESAKLYDRIQKNSYKKYMKSHPLSKMSFEEFKDMNKK